MKPPYKDLWILNGTFLTQDSNRRVIRGNLLVRDGRIAEIRSRAPRLTSQVKSKIKTIDAKGLTILPGLIQTHVHLCQTLFRNLADDLELLDWLSKRIWPLEAAHNWDTLYTSARLGIYELLSSGTTCLLDMATVQNTDAILEAVRESGIRANVGKCLMDHPQTTPKNLREKTKDALTEASDLFIRWNGQARDRIRISFAPRFVISCTEQLLREVRTLSETHGALIHTHASENLKEIQVVKRIVNCENIEYLHQIELTGPKLVLAHCIWLKPGELQILKKTGTHVAHCPSSNLKLASGFARIPEMLTRGINVTLGADGAPCNNQLNLFEEMRLAALIHKPGAGPASVRAQEVLDMATVNGAKALSWSHDIGSIEIGKKADLIALNLETPRNLVPPSIKSAGRGVGPSESERIASTIVYSTSPSELQWSMVQGEVLYQKGRGVKGFDSKKLVAEALRARDQVLRRAKLNS